MSIRGMLAGSIGLAAMAMPVYAADTTADRLLNTDKEPGNWLMVHHDYNNSRHSPLDDDQSRQRQGPQAEIHLLDRRQCDRRNVAGQGGRTPLVEDGFMYVADTWSRVMKFDVRSGTKAIPLWRYDPKTTKARTNRGIACLATR